MRRSLFHISYLGAILGLTTSVMAAAPALDTNANILATINKLAPVYTLTATDAEIEEIYSSITGELDGAVVGAVASTSPCYVYYNPTTSILTAQSYVTGAWRTLVSSALPASWTTGTPTVTLTENLRNGSGSPASPFTLVFTITATGTPAIPLTNTGFAAYLAKATTNTLTTVGGTPIVSTGTLPAGWAVKAQLFDGAAAAVVLAGQNPVLDAISSTLTVNITPPSSTTAMVFSATVANLNTWNVAAASATAFPLTFTSAGRVITYNIYPGAFSRTVGATAYGILGNTINLLNSSNNNLSQTSQGYLPTLTSTSTNVLSLLGATPPSDVKTGLVKAANKKISSPGFNTTSYLTTLGLTQVTVGTGGKIGFLALTAADITSVTWALSGNVLTATGTIGSAPAKAFSCDVSTLLSGSVNIVNSILQFSAKDGDSFFFKTFVVDAGATSPLDGTTNTNIATVPLQKAALAIQLTALFGTVATIPHKTLDLICGA